MSSRREFIQKTGALATLGTLQPLLPRYMRAECEQMKQHAQRTPVETLTTDEEFWAWVREQYTTSSTIINLNNGGVGPQPRQVQEAHIRYYQMCNEGPSYFMWRVLDQGRENLRNKLAAVAGCDAEEVAINRNSTEGLNSVIFGLNLKKGDEVVLCRYDYPNMMNAWKQREKRDGIVLKWIDLELPTENDDYVLKQYSNAITERTKVVHITHMINWTGQLMPVRKIADMAHARGCEVVVDGAHTFAHIKHSITDTGADYYATSLHKWLCAPFGSGMLYIRKNKIAGVWALLSNDVPDGDNIRKFETLGTRSFASEMAIAQAVDFYDMLGADRKEARLRYLKDYWVGKVKSLPRIHFYSPISKAYSCALANFGIEGWKASQIEAKLFEMKKIHSVAIEYEKVNGVRITPNVYTSLRELDMLADGIEKIHKMNP